MIFEGGKILRKKGKLASSDFFILHIRPIVLILESLSLSLLVVSILGQSLKFWTNFENAFGLVDLFNFAATHSVATMYAVLLLLTLALLLGMISADKVQKEEPYQSHWMFLTILTAYLSINKQRITCPQHGHAAIGNIFK